jgi:predicted branched-subunit amino acid permease
MSGTPTSAHWASDRPDAIRAFRRGALVALPLQVATAPFGLILGALAFEIGLDAFQTMAMAVIVVAIAARWQTVGPAP